MRWFSSRISFSSQGKPPDWQDFVGIVVLLLINSTISFVEENNAGNAAAALMARLAPKAKVMMNNIESFINFTSIWFCEIDLRTFIGPSRWHLD